MSDSEAEKQHQPVQPPQPPQPTMSVDFLAQKPIQDSSDLSNQWSRFKEEFELFLTAAEKSGADDKVKVAIMLRCIGPRGVDIFKSFTFGTGKSKDVYICRRS